MGSRTVFGRVRVVHYFSFLCLVLFVCVLCLVCTMWPMYLDSPFKIVPLGFSDVYLNVLVTVIYA